MPPSSPERHLAERVWPLTTGPLAATRAFADLAEREAVQAPRCLALQAQPARGRAVTLFRW